MKCDKVKFFITTLITILYCSNTAIAKGSNHDSAVAFAIIKEKNLNEKIKFTSDFIYDLNCKNGNNLAIFYESFPSDESAGGVIDYDLIYDAFVKNDTNSLLEINSQLIAFKDYPNSEGGDDGLKRVQPFGLDGIIVYSSKPKPRFMSLTTPRNYKHKIKTFYIKNVKDKASIQDAFCKAIPHYTGIPK